MADLKKIKEIFRKQFPFLTEGSIELLLSIGKLKTYKNKESIIRFGQKTDTISFVLEGMVRGFYIDENGEEKTVFLRPTLTFFAPPETIDGQRKSKYTYEAIGVTEMISLPFTEYEKLTKTDLGIAQLFIEGLKETTLTLVFRVESLVGKMPEERYLALLEQYPQFFQKAYNKHIANYLGITPNSLSRIIKRLKEGES
ncbi:MAG: CRP-like cAMP-binding protein [Saprospiraceae bacterium]